MLQKQISADLVAAMKAKDTTTLNVLRVLKGEIQRAEQSSNGKIELSDADIVKLVKKSIEGINETGGDQSEVAVLEKYMPKQMTEIEINLVVIPLILNNNYNSSKDMGKIMGYFNQNYAGQYDGKLLSEVVKNLLTNIQSINE
jgi:uncharacterized protein YqeY